MRRDLSLRCNRICTARVFFFQYIYIYTYVYMYICLSLTLSLSFFSPPLSLSLSLSLVLFSISPSPSLSLSPLPPALPPSLALSLSLSLSLFLGSDMSTSGGTQARGCINAVQLYSRLFSALPCIKGSSSVYRYSFGNRFKEPLHAGTLSVLNLWSWRPLRTPSPRVPGFALRASTAGTELCVFGFACSGLQ